MLPSSGRVGETPDWPLDGASPRELVLWGRYWQMPQAVVWEWNRQFDEVALFVRVFVEAEAAGASVSARTLVKQLQDVLGLSLGGMLRYRWHIGVEPPAPIPPADRPESPRDRLRVVEGDA